MEKVRITGAGSGEKTSEELLGPGEKFVEDATPGIKRIVIPFLSWEDYCYAVDRLKERPELIVEEARRL
jgi:FlaA1/EpsC-like NDP-sugar epimerase